MVQRFVLIHVGSIKELTRAADFTCLPFPKEMGRVLFPSTFFWRLATSESFGGLPLFQKGARSVIFRVLERSGNAFLLLYLFIATLKSNVI